jgi:hypothetical protein
MAPFITRLTLNLISVRQNLYAKNQYDLHMLPKILSLASFLKEVSKTKEVMYIKRNT